MPKVNMLCEALRALPFIGLRPMLSEGSGLPDSKKGYPLYP
ncbi:hypothetical protein CBN_A0025 [Clostridium botulinum NCTC 2916]|nr:hypothetical protein CBN_A0025 [Clostridium botulinum NCTC 2916]